MTAPNLEGSDGNPCSPIWVIGRDYGATEAKDGLPFRGQAGDILNRALESAGLVDIEWDSSLARTRRKTSKVFIDNLVRKQPHGNKWENHSPADIEEGRIRLLGLIDKYQPKVIITLGDEATKTLTKTKESILAVRGYPFRLANAYLSPHTVIYPAVHPAYANRVWVPWRLTLDLDIQKAAANKPIEEFPSVRVCHPNTRESRSLAIRLHEVFNSPPAKLPFVMAVDIENTHDLQLACFGVSDGEHCWVIPNNGPEERTQIACVCDWEAGKVLHNGQYDRYFLEKYGGPAFRLRHQTFDTMLAWHALQPELAGKGEADKGKGGKVTQKSLRFLASLYLNVPFWKDYDFGHEVEQWQLNANDCYATYHIGKKLWEELQ